MLKRNIKAVESDLGLMKSRTFLPKKFMLFLGEAISTQCPKKNACRLRSNNIVEMELGEPTLYRMAPGPEDNHLQRIN